jgi:hypothetical protein
MMRLLSVVVFISVWDGAITDQPLPSTEEEAFIPFVIREVTGVLLHHMGWTSDQTAYLHVVLPVDFRQVAASATSECNTIIDYTEHDMNRNASYGAPASHHHVDNLNFRMDGLSTQCRGIIQNFQGLLHLGKKINPRHARQFSEAAMVWNVVRGVATPKLMAKLEKLYREHGTSIKQLFLKPPVQVIDFLRSRRTHTTTPSPVAHLVTTSTQAPTTPEPPLPEEIFEGFEARFRSWHYDGDKASAATILVESRALHVRTLTTMIQSLHQHRFPVDLATPDAVALLISAIGTKAKSSGYVTLASERSHLYQLETSFWSVEPGVVHIALHVPMHRPNTEFRLKEYLSLPAPLSTRTLIDLAPEDNIIAIRDDNEFFRTTTTADLAKCEVLEDHYYCPTGNVRFEATKAALPTLRPQSQCIYYLFKQLASDADKACPKKLLPFFNDVRQIGTTRFVAYVTHTQQVTIICASRKINDKRTIRAPRTDFDLAEGCEIVFDDPVNMGASSGQVVKGFGSLQTIVWDSSAPSSHEGLDVTWYERRRDHDHIDMPSGLTEAKQLEHSETALQALQDAEWYDRLWDIAQAAAGTTSLVTGVGAMIKLHLRLSQLARATHSRRNNQDNDDRERAAGPRAIAHHPRAAYEMPLLAPGAADPIARRNNLRDDPYPPLPFPPPPIPPTENGNAHHVSNPHGIVARVQM